MNNMKKYLAMLLCVVFVFSLFAACSKREEKTDAPSKEETVSNNKESKITEEEDKDENKKNPVTLTTVSMYGGTDPNAENYQNINAKFMEMYPYITIEDDSQSADQDWKLKSQPILR